jgi:hypothetical protein
VGTNGKIKFQAKHYSMGRLAIELPYTMPDKQTVYITDDGDNVMLGLYVASKPGDMSCGSLYAAKFIQTGLGAYDGAQSCPPSVSGFVKSRHWSRVLRVDRCWTLPNCWTLRCVLVS